MDMIIEQVKEYYGKHLMGKKDLASGACCANEREFYVVLYYKPCSVLGFGGRPRLRLGFCCDV